MYIIGFKEETANGKEHSYVIDSWHCYEDNRQDDAKNHAHVREHKLN